MATFGYYAHFVSIPHKEPHKKIIITPLCKTGHFYFEPKKGEKKKQKYSLNFEAN